MLGFTARDIAYKGQEVMMELFRTLVRPHLDYHVLIRSHQYGCGGFGMGAEEIYICWPALLILSKQTKLCIQLDGQDGVCVNTRKIYALVSDQFIDF